MFNKKIYLLVSIGFLIGSCKAPSIGKTPTVNPVPVNYGNEADSSKAVIMPWRSFFTDANLVALIDTALKNNQELSIALQEIEMARNDIRFRRGALFPSVTLGGGIGVEKVGRYTSQGAGDASTEIKPGKEVPDALMDYTVAARATWEVDIWKKLRNARKAAIARYLATVEGRNYVVTNLVGEVAESYYELLALDNELEIVRQNIQIQQNALDIVKVQKEAARATELAVQKFQAEVLKSQGMEFDLLQQLKVTENRINLLLGRFPQTITRNSHPFLSLVPMPVDAGLPSQLLENRPDLKQAELNLEAARLDVKVARAEFFPSLGISASLGLQAFNPSYILRLPESLLYSLAGDLAGPLVNRQAIKAEFNNANARQLQALYNYQRTILQAYLEVSNQLSSVGNLEKSYALKQKQVEALTRSIDIANDLFKSARADYFEVLMTQRDALEARLELVETKQQQMTAAISLYRELGGGWK